MRIYIYKIHLRYIISHHPMCSNPNAWSLPSPPPNARYVPRVHAEDSGLCGLVFTDDQLVRRCRSFRKNAPWTGGMGGDGGRDGEGVGDG